MRKKVVLYMMIMGVFALGCGCGKNSPQTEKANTSQESSDTTSEESSSEEVKKDSTSQESSSEQNQQEDSSKEGSGEEKKEEEPSKESSGEESKEEDPSKESSGEEKKEEDPSKENTGEETQKEDSSSGAFDQDNGKTLDQIFEDCASIGEGVAGVSLKRTTQAYEVARYAAKNKFTEESAEKLKKAFAERYEKLDDDGKESFDGAFDSIMFSLDEAIVKGHFETVRGEFDDVGAAEKMEKLLLKQGLRKSWDIIKEAYSALNK